MNKKNFRVGFDLMTISIQTFYTMMDGFEISGFNAQNKDSFKLLAFGGCCSV